MVYRLLVASLLLLGVVVSFQIPQQILHAHHLAVILPEVSSSTNFGFLLSDAVALNSPTPDASAVAAAAAGIPNPGTFFNGNVGETVRNIAVGVTATIFLFAGVTFIAAAILVPAGAQQLEIECKAFLPETWDTYMSKLEEGQEIKDRPDLMFELGLLLNKAKADRLQQVCVELKLAPDLWQKYQNKLLNEQDLQDRPELIVQLNTDVGERAAQILRENTNICPSALWNSYESRTDNNENLNSRPDLLDELARELGYSDLLGAVVACLGGARAGQQPQQEQRGGDAVIDATTMSGITEVRRNENQWDEDDE